MHHEYAVEPTAIGASWETFLYVFEKFGFQRGRLISRFPKKWESLVIDAARNADIGDLARKRIVEKLTQGKRTTLIRRGRDYNPTLGNWADNALASHATEPFRAIIAHEERPDEAVVSLAELDETHHLMEAPTSRDVPRTAVELSGACRYLLHAAREINLVDPYFDLGPGGGGLPLST